ncbi:MAG: holin family protein [Roseinatronobacter sp.]
MGLIAKGLGALFGSAAQTQALGQTVTQVAEVFRPNATRALELGHDAFAAVHASHMAEFQHARSGWFDTAVNGLNRLPRPLMALGTLALFVYAMADPAGFGVRMAALALVPEPLWWLLGAVVAFYFGAREAHHLRLTKVAAMPVAVSAKESPIATPSVAVSSMPVPPSGAAPLDTDPEGNAALAEWRSQTRAAP